MNPHIISVDTVLAVFARNLVDELRPINFLAEWSRNPLEKLMPELIEILNLHSRNLGDVISEAYDSSVPELKTGNIVQLESILPNYFAKTKQYYLDMYDVQSYEKSSVVASLDASRDHSVLTVSQDRTRAYKLAMSILNVFSELSAAQVDEHRTLERICRAFAPTCYRFELTTVGFDLIEYHDQWRHLGSYDRNRLRTEILERWQ